MRKVICLLVFLLFLCSCACVTESDVWKQNTMYKDTAEMKASWTQSSDFWKHDTMYKNFDHMKYSWCPCDPVYSKTKDPSWWGIPTKQCK